MTSRKRVEKSQTKPRKAVARSDRAIAAGVTPSLYPETLAGSNAEKIERVLLRLMNGELLLSSCKAEQLHPMRLYEWRDASSEHAERYARARMLQAEQMAEDTITIADDSSGDVVVDDLGRVRQNTEFTARSRLRFDARRWFLSKMAPAMFGDKLDVTTRNAKPLDECTPDELRAIAEGRAP